MVTSDYIDLTLIARSYSLQLGLEMINEQKKGCDDCADKLANQILQLIMLTEQIFERIERGELDGEAESLYNCLLGAVAGYSGASLSLDPNAVNPDINIIVEGGSGVTLPYWEDIPWSEMTNDTDGYRDTYFNAEWIDYNPMIQIQGVVMYQVGVDYDNDGLGTITFKSGKGIYDGQFFRAGNFQPYTEPTPPYPLPNTYRFVNNSSIDTEYSITGLTPLVVGQTVEGNITLGMSLLGLIQSGQQLRFRRYNADGTVDYELVSTNPPSNQTGTTAVDLTKGYEFIYTDYSSSLPSPPTNGIVDDLNNTFTFTLATT